MWRARPTANSPCSPAARPARIVEGSSAGAELDTDRRFVTGLESVKLISRVSTRKPRVRETCGDVRVKQLQSKKGEPDAKNYSVLCVVRQQTEEALNFYISIFMIQKLGELLDMAKETRRRGR